MFTLNLGQAHYRLQKVFRLKNCGQVIDVNLVTSDINHVQVPTVRLQLVELFYHAGCFR